MSLAFVNASRALIATVEPVAPWASFQPAGATSTVSAHLSASLITHVKTVHADILTAPEHIVQQVNATSTRPQGLSASLAKAFPNDYYYKLVPPAQRRLGTAYSTGKVIHLCAQRRPGKPSGTDDTSKQRLEWFKAALADLTRQMPDADVALPYGIGCGLAGGDWPTYLSVIDAWTAGHHGSVSLFKLQTEVSANPLPWS